MTPEEIESSIAEIQSLSDAPFGVNFHMYVPYASLIVDICIANGVRAVSFQPIASPKTKS